MNVRSAEVEDTAGIQNTAEQSFQTSYSLSPDQIRVIVDAEFSEDAIEAKIDDPDRTLLVAVGDESKIVGFVDLERNDETTLYWLHVDPAVRGQGIASSLIEEVQNELGGDDRFTAQILREASEGGEFLERFGLSEGDSGQVDIGGETFHYHMYTPEGRGDDTSGDGTEDANEPTVDVPPRITEDGDELVVDQDERIPGTEAPFFAVFRDTSSEERYGFFCSECGSTEISADGLDRLECENCGNQHLPDEYDDAYL